jgi:hypothetical protein
MSWVNKITLDRYIHHDAARKKLATVMSESNKTEDDIYRLVVTTDAGYVEYKLIYRDETESPVVFDDGTVV